MDNKWKYPLIKQQKAQVIRVMRPNEVHALIDNIRIEDEPKWTKSRDYPNLQESGFTTEEIQMWMKFYLYSGCRFNEGLFIHEYTNPDGSTLYQNNGTLWLPVHKGKGKRSIKTRTIFFSHEGRKIMDEFFSLPLLPSETEEQKNQTMTSLSQIMHKSGSRINLPETTLNVTIKHTLRDDKGDPIIEMVPTNQFTPNPDGTYAKIMKPRIKTETEEKPYTTNGCAFRSLRKTWESWLTSFYGNNVQMRERILSSQGHKKEIALTHYLEIAFDTEDLKDIEKEVEGFAVL